MKDSIFPVYFILTGLLTESLQRKIYDKKNNYFITPKLWPSSADKEEVYWKSYDWNRAAAAEMKTSGLPYSGEYGFASTEMYWWLNHMVAPAKAALQCNNCHGIGGLS